MNIAQTLLEWIAAWSRIAASAPVRSALVSLLLTLALLQVLGNIVRSALEARGDRVAGGPIFAFSGVIVFFVSILWWITDGILNALGKALLFEQILLWMVPQSFGNAVAALRALLQIPENQSRLLPPGPVHLPIAWIGASLLYLVLVLWIGRTLAELTSLEQKPEDVLAKEREEQQKAIQKALKEGRPLPTQDVVSLPLADDLFGRTFKWLGHWTSVELVEERFIRWQKPLVGALTALLLFSVPAVLSGALGASIWAGAAVLLDGLRRNLKTPKALTPPPPKQEPETKEKPAETIPLRPLVETIHKEAGPLYYAPELPPAKSALIAPGTNLKAKRILEQLRKNLPFDEGLLMHQGLACDAFAARRNVLISMPPLSGNEALFDLLILYTLLVDAEGVLYLASDEKTAKEAEERLRARAAAARWRWSVHSENIAGRAGRIDPSRSQPSLLFADPRAIHRELCARRKDWSVFLGGLGLVVIPELDMYGGVRGAHLAHLLHRLRRAAALCSPLQNPGPQAQGERIRFLTGAEPSYRELGRFAERIIGRPLSLIGPEVDGAPEPDRIAYVLSGGFQKGDEHPAVAALGEALAQGFAAELWGYDEELAFSDVARANERMLSRAVATRGRSFAEGASPSEIEQGLIHAQVVIARANAARWFALPRLISHLGWKGGTVTEARIASLGAGEKVGKGATAKAKEPPPPPEGEQSPMPTEVTAEALAAADLGRQVLVLLHPGQNPLVRLLAMQPKFFPMGESKGLCSLVIDPCAQNVESAHFRYALSEAEMSRTELEAEFSRDALHKELNRAKNSPRQYRLIERVRQSIDRESGELIRETVFSLSLSDEELEQNKKLSLDTAGEPMEVVDCRTGEHLFDVEAIRGLSAAYPGRVFVRRGRRYSILSENVQDQLKQQRILCEREERPIQTMRVRQLKARSVERREKSDKTERPLEERRKGALRNMGGKPFALELLPADIEEELVGFRRFDQRGREIDFSYYSEPISSAFRTRATFLGLPGSSFGELDDATLHALCHLFQTALPFMLLYREEDLDITSIRNHGAHGDPAIVFVDMHPGGAGFADAISVEMLKPMIQGMLALLRSCPGRCSEGCENCLYIPQCHAEPERAKMLNKAAATKVLALMLGNLASNAT